MSKRKQEDPQENEPNQAQRMDEDFYYAAPKIVTPRPLINVNLDFGNLPIPGFVWFFILAVPLIWGGWYVAVAHIFPDFTFPMEVLLWTLGTVFFFIGLVKMPTLWCIKTWLLTVVLMGVFVVVRYYIPSLDLATALLASGVGGGMIGFFVFMIEAELS